MRVIIAGSRSFIHYPTLQGVCNHYLKDIQNPHIVCGHARGADSLAFTYAKERFLPVKSFHPNWAQYGRSAGFIRNQQMAEFAQALILFWNGTSPGSRSMLQQAKQQGLQIRVFYFNQLFSELGPPLKELFH